MAESSASMSPNGFPCAWSSQARLPAPWRPPITQKCSGSIVCCPSIWEARPPRPASSRTGSGLPILIPSVDMIEIGAGGGSIASMSDLGLLKVGPQSAGSVPGPVCYGRGGQNPTVTDADLVLGYVSADHFLGGDMKLDLSAAEKQLSQLAEALGTSLVETASGIYRVVGESMTAAARAHAADRGIDYRGLPLFAFGGA